ncbi:hypothetical protein KJN74_05990 [Candidatus Bathyarchaeota archaeon]|nr:hypothetical protein [Candidatus Bathyarchaeota archaeon]
MKTQNMLSRFAVALGGFLIFFGIILTSVIIIVLFDGIDFSLDGSENLLNISLVLFFVLGLLDLTAGIILWRR